MAEVAVTTMTQYPSTTTEEKPTCHKGNITDSDLQSPIDHTTCGSPHYMERPCSYNVTNIPNHNIYILNPQYPSTHIKEEPFLTDPNIYTPIDDTPQHPATHIKEETASCDEDLLDLSDSTTADHTQLMFSHIKKKPVSSDGGTLLELNVDTPTNHTQYKSHIKEEPVSCNGGNRNDPDSYTPTGHTQHYPTNIKAEEAMCDEDCAGSNGFLSTDLFSINEERVSSNKASLADLDIGATIDISTQPYQSTYMKNEPDSYSIGYYTNMDCTTDHTSHPSEGEPVLEKVSLLQKIEYSSPPKLMDKNISQKNNKEPEQNKNLTISKKYFCTIQQTANSLEILYNCPECPERFMSNLELVKHQVIHTVGIPYMCHVCGRRFGEKLYLVNHQVTHRGNRDFPCPYCELSFGTESSLINHKQTHVQKEPMPCPECGKTFPNKSRLIDHQVIHTQERPFKCSQCGDTFKRKKNLLKHQTVHKKSAHKTGQEKKKVYMWTVAGSRLELL